MRRVNSLMILHVVLSACVVILVLSAALHVHAQPADLRMYWSHGTATGQGPVRLTHSPMNLEDIAHIIPMGLMVGAHVTPVDHMYFEPKDRNAGRYRYDVYAPADGFIVHIQHRTMMSGTMTDGSKERDDYRVVMEHSSTFWSYYDLITQLDQTILDQIGGPPPDMKPVKVRVPVKAGQLIGKVGGQTLDFAVVNSEVTLKGFVVPRHYDYEPWKIHTVNPFDYFDEPLKSTLLAKNPRKAKPRGGKIDYDIDGKLAGNWFLENTNGYAGAGDPRGYWMGHLAIVYHHIFPQKIVVSIGDFDGRMRQFFVKDNMPDPAQVSSASRWVKYELIPENVGSSGQPQEGVDTRVQGVLLVQVLQNRKLRVETFPGKTAAEVKGFTSAKRIYER